MIDSPAYQYNQYIELYHQLPRKYIDESVPCVEDTFDRQNGLSYVGLYELLFKKDPIVYAERDLEEYISAQMTFASEIWIQTHKFKGVCCKIYNKTIFSKP